MTWVQVQRAGDDAVVRVAGEVDVAGSWVVLDAVHSTAVAWDRTSRLVLDLGEVTFLDSSGLGVLVQAREVCREQGTVLVLREVPDRVRKLLALTGLTDSFVVEDDVDGQG